ncbi:3-keto-5-aminohexanoate cleavage protein [Roseibium sp.]|uniref:3-keto-5-aminohexanoate cleavage protein n=1 Tax=Roseibium sp. TaxID=1936156 RepID=UPI003B51CACA
MQKSMFITAAPVGAVPKRLNAEDPKFLSKGTLAQLAVDAVQADSSLQDLLTHNGWETVGSGGLHICFTPMHPANGLPDSIFANMPYPSASKLASLLFTQGWRSDRQGKLFWPWGRPGGSSYIPPSLANDIRAISNAEAELLKAGWTVCDAGVWQPGRGCSPYLPVSPEDIIRESLACFQAGAAIVHLHTRDMQDEIILRSSDGSVAARLSQQANCIDVPQYDQIIPAVAKHFPEGVLNISTSVRGSRSDFDSPKRRSALKRYDVAQRVPDIATFSPGSVRFKAGGGYENNPGFLADQAAHLQEFGIRPEVEVFNQTILERATGSCAGLLKTCGEPILFMLVAGVDQVGEHADGGLYDDSLIPSPIKDEAIRLLKTCSVPEAEQAAQLLIDGLKPVVQKIRSRFPDALISILLPGPLQALIVDVALALNLDGIRVGLEDSLTIPDPLVPGGSRKALGTYEQVDLVYHRLSYRNVRIITSAELKDMLGQTNAPAPLQEIA